MIVTFSANILGESVLTAYAASDPLDTIRQYFDNMGHDWNKVANLFTSNQVDGYIEFFSNEDCINGNVGFLNINDAELVEIVEVSYDDIKDNLSGDYILGESRFYVVGVDYSVKEDSIFFSNGISYNGISLVLENEGWKICENVQIAEPEELLEKGYTFSDEYDGTVEMMEEREKGILINGDGDQFDTIGQTVEVRNTKASNSLVQTYSEHAINSAIGIPKSTTPIYLGYYDSDDKTKFLYYVDEDCNADFKPAAISFWDYCLAVTAGECRDDDFDGKARKAIVLAIKTYTWYHIIHPSDIGRGVYLKLWKKSSDGLQYGGSQCYAPYVVNENPQVTIDYTSMKDVWMESALGYIFEARYESYRSDKYKDINYGYSMYRTKTDPNVDYVALSQDGCRYLADKHNYNVYQILRYYYSDSKISKGAVKFFTTSGRRIK